MICGNRLGQSLRRVMAGPVAHIASQDALEVAYDYDQRRAPSLPFARGLYLVKGRRRDRIGSRA